MGVLDVLLPIKDFLSSRLLLHVHTRSQGWVRRQENGVVAWFAFIHISFPFPRLSQCQTGITDQRDKGGGTGGVSYRRFQENK